MATDAEDPAYAFSFAVNDDWAAYLTQQLIAFNQPHASPLWQHSPYPPAPLQLYAQDAAGTIIGGVIGRTNAIPKWLEITILWLDTAHRGRGLGRQLMHLAEAEATQRGCRYARVNTAQFQAPGFYTKLGYALRTIGKLSAGRNDRIFSQTTALTLGATGQLLKDGSYAEHCHPA